MSPDPRAGRAAPADVGDLACRPATETDLPAVAELFLVARAAAVPAMPPVPAGAESVVRADITSWDLRRRETWLAEVDGRPVGFAVVVDDWLEALYVAPTAQRAGVGSVLLDLVRSLRPAGFCLWVFTRNAPARAFYAGHGLVELEHTDGSANPEAEPDVRVAWPGEDPLTFHRSLIDDVDEQLGDLLARRAALTGAVRDLKGDVPRDAEREREVAARVAARVPALGVDRVARIVDVVITESLDAARS